MAQPREAVPSFRDRMVYLISPVNLRVPEGFVRALSPAWFIACAR